MGLFSPSLSWVMIYLPKRDLNIAFDLKLETLDIESKTLYLEGNGSASYLGLTVGEIKHSEASQKILASVRRLSVGLQTGAKSVSIDGSIIWEHL